MQTVFYQYDDLQNRPAEIGRKTPKLKIDANRFFMCSAESIAGLIKKARSKCFF